MDPFARLGLSADADLAAVRAARRRLARDAHPDRGGELAAMQEINAAFDAAVRAIRARRPSHEAPAAPTPPTPSPSGPPEAGRGRPEGSGPVRRPVGRRRVGRFVDHDDPSFSVDVLPVEAFEAITIVTAWYGEMIDDDPPYAALVHLYEPSECVARLTLVPEAGATMVSLAVAALEGAPPPPSAEAVRDLYVAGLNGLGPAPGPRV